MSQVKSKEQLVRLAWLTELRRQGHRQCFGAYYGDSANTKVCALGLLAEIAGVDAEEFDETHEVGAFAGLSCEQTTQVWHMNDGDGDFAERHTFAEIADVVATWFPND